jgi:hypothetical protein
MKTSDPLTLLTRPDKWYLGGGGRLLWAPPFPLFLDRPGFWDEAHYYNIKFQPLFTWTLLDEDGDEIELQKKDRTWNPAVLTQRFTSSDKKLSVEEKKSILPNDVAVSNISITNRSGKTRRLHLVAWTAQETHPITQTAWLSDLAHRNGTIAFEKHVKQADRPTFRSAAILGVNRRALSFAINLSEGSLPPPQWNLTPFYEQFAERRLANTEKLHGVTDDGLLFMALHVGLDIRPREEQFTAIALALASSTHEARQNLNIAIETENPNRLSEVNWNDHFSSVPYFECSDEYLNRYYWYRWYGLKLNTIATGEDNYSYPFVCEGIGYFRAAISYSAMCHMLENRWMHTPELAQGSLLTFIDNQRDDGGFRGYIDVNYYRQEMFYHANWGNSLLQLRAVHPSAEFLQKAYEGLKKYAYYFDRARDEEVSGLFDIDNHYETGQEYMHRYTAVNPNADQDNWGEVFRLKGVDVTIYMYELKRALSRVARELGKSDEADLWDIEAERIKAAVLERMWDPKEEMFFDVDPATGKRTMVKAGVCFYPYFTNIVSEQHLAGLKRHLFNPKEFWTKYPVPSSSADDEFFSSEPEWKGKRMNCPWNGRVWPMTNSHVAEALACGAIRFNDIALKKRTVEFTNKFIRMMFDDGDPARPNCFEHYNPLSGQPSRYRGIDDYQHSWVVDLIIKYVCGVRPDEHGVTVDPFPFGLKHILIDDIIVRGWKLKVEIKGKRFTVWVDGKTIGHSTVGKPIVV